MNAITLLKQDHKIVRDLFNKYERTTNADADQRKELVGKIIRELSAHAAIEEQVFYPAVRKEVDGASDVVLESLEEHHVVKWLLSELEYMSPSEERYDAKVHVLMENVRRHIEEEEEELFPKASSSLGRSRLDDIGRQLSEAKAIAPTQPQPRAPDSPPMNQAPTLSSRMTQTASSRAGSGGHKVVSALNRRRTASTASSKNARKPPGKAGRTAKPSKGKRRTATSKAR